MRQLARNGLGGLLCVGLFVGCASTPAPKGEVPTEAATPSELGQSDVNRMATLGMRANLDSLFNLADKLYRRNPREWRKGGFASREQALAELRAAVEQRQPWPSLAERRDVAALAWALSPEFPHDRVSAFIAACADMIIVAHGGKTTFYLTDGLDAQSLYNAARNVEIAVWMLAQRRDAAGQPLLLADEMGPQGRNLSFEREFGKIVGRLDLLAMVTAEKYRRAVVSYVQNLLGGSLWQFLPVRPALP